MGGEVTFTMREATRYSLIHSLLEGKMVNKDAASALRLSLRQIKRLKKKVELKGAFGVIHGNKGRLPSHAFSPEVRHQIISLTEKRYRDFNFSHLSEMLEDEEGIRINRDTLRQWLRPRGFGSRARKISKHRRGTGLLRYFIFGSRVSILTGFGRFQSSYVFGRPVVCYHWRLQDRPLVRRWTGPRRNGRKRHRLPPGY